MRGAETRERDARECARVDLGAALAREAACDDVARLERAREASTTHTPRGADDARDAAPSNRGRRRRRRDRRDACGDIVVRVLRYCLLSCYHRGLIHALPMIYSNRGELLSAARTVIVLRDVRGTGAGWRRDEVLSFLPTAA